MALSKHIIDLAFHLKYLGYFDEVRSVMDMGDQDLNENYDYLKKKIPEKNFSKLSKNFENAKSYPNRPRVSSSCFWKSIGIEKTDRLDLIQLERKNDVDHNFFKFDLNLPFDHNLFLSKYDLVTDLGNNEHPFNIYETYKSMHNLTNKNGLMIIQQALFKGNGFYNFEVGFFESLAASNNYEIIYSSYCFHTDDYYFCAPISDQVLDAIRLNEIGAISIIYVLKKKNDNDFKMPYQGLGSKPSGGETFNSFMSYENTFPKRNYVPVQDSLNIKSILSMLIKKIKKKIL